MEILGGLFGVIFEIILSMSVEFVELCRVTTLNVFMISFLIFKFDTRWMCRVVSLTLLLSAIVSYYIIEFGWINPVSSLWILAYPVVILHVLQIYFFELRNIGNIYYSIPIVHKENLGICIRHSDFWSKGGYIVDDGHTHISRFHA